MSKGFYEKSNIASVTNPLNITYDEILHKSTKELDSWIDELRQYIITQWDDEGQPPVIGQNEEDIIKNWKKLFGYDVDSFFDDKTNVVKNFNKFASGVNQFFPTMLKTKISSGVSSEGATSIYDHFKEDDLRDKFKKAMLRGLFRDSMYSFGKSVKKKEMGMNIKEFLTHYNHHERFGITIVKMLNKMKCVETEYLVLDANEVMEYLESGHLTLQNLKTMATDGDIEKYSSIPLEDYTELKNGDKRYYWYYVRLYNRQQRIFPSALQVFRLGLGQPAVNFPPLTAKFLYEHFTKHISEDEKVIVYDPSAGWGGRILGAMTVKRDLHYIGTDPNPDNVGIYERVGDFYNTHCFQSNPFFGKASPNTFEVFKLGSEVIGDDENFLKYFGKLDFVFTSPPYFNREQYSQDENQSFKKFSAYEDWRDNFLKPTLTTAFSFLKNDRYLCWNIADIKIGENKFIPLEQDSIDVVESLGGKYKGIYKMLMTRMIGIDASNVKNSVELNGEHYKFEPILVFYKS